MISIILYILSAFLMLMGTVLTISGNPEGDHMMIIGMLALLLADNRTKPA